MNALVADDDPVVRLLLSRAIEQLGHPCQSVDNGMAALRALEAGRGFDLVVSDWRMPGLDGLQLCRMVRQRLDIEYVYFVVVTAEEDRRHALAGIDAGADDYLIKPVDPFDLRLRLLVAGRVTALHRRLAERQRSLERANKEVADMARSDPLTGLGNRLKLNEDLEALQARMDRYDQGFSLAMFDLDHFKTLNDAAGHPSGDEALRSVAHVIRGELRASDFAYRYGGEEFLVAFAGLDVAQTYDAAERIRRAVQDAAIPHPGRPADRRPVTTGPGVLTVSAGVAAGGRSPHAGVLAADAALYRAKSRGRNQVSVAGPLATLTVSSGRA